MPKLNRKPRPKKPDRPYPEFPLFAHATKRWAKKIRGKLHYFGPWDDPQAALSKYLDQRDDFQAGRTPRVSGAGVTVRDVVNRFLTSKKLLADSGELSPRTYADYFATCERIVEAFGRTRLVDDLAADDFERYRADVASVWGPVAVGNEVQRVRTVFKYGYDQGIIERPIRYGQTFNKPSRKVLRHARNARGPRMFEAEELRTIIKAAPIHLRAMILLGVNCGFGNSDVATLPKAALDLRRGWVNYPRPKTGVQRRCPLWPETVKSLKEAIAKRPAPKDENDEGLVFITKYGKLWNKSIADSPITKEMAKLLDELKIGRKSRNFYCLRHGFETIAGEARDQVAVDHVMGHSRDDMATVYRERIGDERLKAVTDHVRGWLFPKPKRKAKAK